MLLTLWTLHPKAQAQSAYWQQQVNTQIAVQLDDVHSMLHGTVHIDYTNNAPDTLRFIYLHIYPNAYANDRTAYAQQAVENGNTRHYFSNEQDRGYIDSLKFVVTNSQLVQKSAGYVITKNIDVIQLILPEPLLPGQRLQIETPFRVKIPKVFSRLGHLNQTYQISQWFPKPAVYDAKGWHPMPYLDQGEFYSEYGSYQVAITLPENYVVMATGNLQESAEQQWLDSLALSYRNHKPIYSPKDTSIIPSASTLKTVTFTEENVHDFAWFAAKNWIVENDTFFLDGIDKPITAYACYSPKHQQAWKYSLDYIQGATRGYSQRVGLYPYRTIKAIEGPLEAGGGMEYPTVTIIAPVRNGETLNTVITHELGHNWFYGILGSNERDYPWMDESVNSYYENKIAPSAFSITGRNNRYNDSYLAYAFAGSANRLEPSDTASEVYSDVNYGLDVYAKTPLLFDWLAAYMGQDQFDAAMKAYFDKWKFKHPQPEDFRTIFQEKSTKSLQWFFDDVMKTTTPIDFAIRQANSKGFVLKNITGVMAPVKINFYPPQSDSIISSMWVEPFKGEKYVSVSDTIPYDRVVIDPVILDYNVRNNANTAPLAIKPFLGLNLQQKTKLWVAPALGYNYYDGFMAGALLHNIALPTNKFQFIAAPMYGFGSKRLVGTGIVGYTWNRYSGILQDVQFTIEGKSFNYRKTNNNLSDYIHQRFMKAAAEVVFNFRKPTWRSKVQRSLSIKAYNIKEGAFDYVYNPTDSLYYPKIGKTENEVYGRIRYQHQHDRTFNPFSYTLEAQGGKNFAKISAELNVKIDYFLKNKGLHVRAYAGKFFNLATVASDASRYVLNTTYNGWNDYLYDETFIGRNQNSGLWSQQVSIKEGGFKVNTLQYANMIGQSDDWLLALNLKSDLPLGRIPIRVFADVATFANAKTINPSGSAILFVAGIELYLKDVMNVYIPLFMSKDYSDYTKSIYGDKKFFKSITFSFNLNSINWMKMHNTLLNFR